MEQLSFWQNECIRFFQFKFSFHKLTQHDLKTNTNDNTIAFFVKKLHHQTYKLFIGQPHPPKIIFQNYKFTSPFCYHSHYSLNHLYTIGTIRNYDPAKQYYILFPYHDPTRPYCTGSTRSQ